MNIVKEIKNFVKKECEKPGGRYKGAFDYHFKPVVRIANKLSKKYGGDSEIILLAAWLHDIGSIMKSRKNHHITGAKIAEKKLQEFDYPQEKIELIKKCILNHRGSINNKRESLEERIVAEADVISNFDNIEGIFKAALVYEGKNKTEACQEVYKKLERKWKQIYFDSSREMLKPKMEAVRILFGK